MNDLYTNSAEFLRAVMALRAIPPFYQSLAAHAAAFWSNEDRPVDELPDLPRHQRPRLRLVEGD